MQGSHPSSPFSESLERIVHDTIGCALEVHRQLGPGLLEAIYADALAIELDLQKLRFHREFEIAIQYRGIPLRLHRVDLVVEGQVLVEIKAVERMHPLYHAQVLSYLRASGLRIGLLINFNSHLLKEGIKRIVL
jgi:GxxExxY protein